MRSPERIRHRFRMDLRLPIIDIHQTDIDALPTTGLVAVYGHHDLGAGLEWFACRRANRDGLVTREIARLLGREDPVDVDLNSFVVIDHELDAGGVDRTRQRHLAAEPDVGSVPGRTNDGSRSFPSAESTGAFLPLVVIEIRPRPFGLGPLERVPPRDGRLLRGRH